MDAKRPSSKLKTTYLVRDKNFTTYSLLVPSNYKKTILLISPLMKFGGEVVLGLLEKSNADTRIVVVTHYNAPIETLRAQLPWYLRDRLIARECELQSASSIKMTTLWLRIKLDRLDVVVHLEPQSTRSTETCGRRTALLCANDCSIDLFSNNLLYYFGNSIEYVGMKFLITEEPSRVVRRVLRECGM